MGAAGLLGAAGAKPRVPYKSDLAYAPDGTVIVGGDDAAGGGAGRKRARGDDDGADEENDLLKGIVDVEAESRAMVEVGRAVSDFTPQAVQVRGVGWRGAGRGGWLGRAGGVGPTAMALLVVWVSCCGASAVPWK